MIKCVLFLILGFYFLNAQTNQDCLDCHDDPELTTERNGREVSLNVDIKILLSSVHPDHDCIDCHTDASEDHPEHLKPVECGDCHDSEKNEFMMYNYKQYTYTIQHEY